MWRDLNATPLRCDLCGAAESRLVLHGTDHREGLGGDFAVRECSVCGLARTDPRPDDPLAWYPRTYQQHSDDAGVTTRVVAFAIRTVAAGRVPRPFASILSWLVPDAALGGPVRPGTPALDVGSGSGGAVQALLAAGVDAHGLEPAQEAVAAARARGVMTVSRGTLDDSPLQADHWDLIRLCQVLEHLPSPRAALERINPALTRDGILAIGVPNFGGLLGRMSRASWDGLELPRHLHHFTPRTLRRLLEETGFEVVAMRTTALFGVLPATLDAWTTGGRRQRGWRKSLVLRAALYPVELILAALGLGDGIVAIARRSAGPTQR